jgi:hypothetical protein
MKIIALVRAVAAAFVALAMLSGAEAQKPAAPVPAELSAETGYEPMKPFAKLAGRAWRGEGTGPDGQPIVDIARYQMILGGRAFQSTHKLEGGTYGGRTIIFFDEGAKNYIFHYFTTAGFHTTGDLTLTDTGFVSVETVEGHDVYAEVRAEAFIGDKEMRVASQYVAHDGVVTEGDGRLYREIDDPGPLFFDEADALYGKRTEVKDAHDRYTNED